MINFEKFNQNLPESFKDLAQFIYEKGFKLSIVGGVPRDYLLYEKVGNDFDCELRPLSSDDFVNSYKKLVCLLSKQYSIEELSYQVTRVVLPDAEAELTLPRIEVFNNEKHHSNFDAKFIADLDYSQGAFRRDFTVNAIYFEYSPQGFALKDPLNGVKDIENKELNFCGKDFVKDPVRFLRACRFSIKHGLSISKKLNNLMQTMELEGLSSHYIKMEVEKSRRPFKMLKLLSEKREDTFSWDFTLDDEYDALFEGSLSEHIKNALFINKDERIKILKSLGASTKGASDLEPVENDKLTEKNLFQIKAWVEYLLKINLVSYQKFLLEWSHIPMSFEQLQKYKTLKVELSEEDKKADKSKYSSLLFKKRFMLAIC